MKLKSVSDEMYCLSTGRHSQFCIGSSHICYRCGMLLAPCRCRPLGSMLDY